MVSLLVMGRNPARDPDLYLGCEILRVSDRCHILTSQPHLVQMAQRVRALMLWQGGCPNAINSLTIARMCIIFQVLAEWITY